jgi:membrane protease YdiL (CAAX protease family)
MRPAVLKRAWGWFISPPTDPITDADRRTVQVVGLELPVRASAAVAVATFALLVDLSRVLVPEAAAQLGRSPAGARAMALERLVLFGVVPTLVVLLAFRDRLSRYGWTFGDGRAGAALAFTGCLVMTPIVLWFAGQPDVRTYYAVSAGPPADVVLTNALELTAAEFLFRGFLLLTLVRTIGPIGVLIAVMPFAFGHVGKPALELLSTIGGGLAYGWLAWRTRSIVWGSIAHVYILSLVILAAAAAAPTAMR